MLFTFPHGPHCTALWLGGEAAAKSLGGRVLYNALASVVVLMAFQSILTRAGFMRIRHIICLLLLLLLPVCLSISPPKNRPPRSSAPESQPPTLPDPSIIIPLYKEALKADAEGRPEESLRLLSIPPLSLSPGILATCSPLPHPPTYSATARACLAAFTHTAQSNLV